MDNTTEEKFAKLKTLLTTIAPYAEAEEWMVAKEADKKITKREGDLFSAWRELGSCLTSLRMRHKSDRDFGAACIENEINRTPQHIGAAIWLSSLDDDQLSTLREEFPTAMHPATLQNKCRELYPEWVIGTREAGLHSVETTLQSEKLPEMPVFTDKKEESPNQNIAKDVTTKPLRANSPLAGRERAEEVNFLVSGWDRATVSKVHKDYWHLVLESMDLGLLSSEGVVPVEATGRILFNLPLQKKNSALTTLGGFNLLKPAGCKLAEESLMPFLRKHAEALKADPDSFTRLWTDESKSKREEIIKADQEEKHAKSMAEIASRGEKEVIVCGKQLWPPVHTNFTSYTYEQLRLAWFMFLDAESIATANLWMKEGRKSRAIGHRWLAKNYNASFASFKDKPGCEELVEHARGVSTAYIALAEALQNGPDENMQTSIPWKDINISSSK